jgi:hypothetical protein
MARRFFLFVVLAGCSFLVIYISIDPVKVTGESTCCTVPSTEVPVANGYGSGSTLTKAVFDMNIQNPTYPTMNWNEYLVGEFSSTTGYDTCNQDYPASIYLPVVKVSTPYPTYYWLADYVGDWDNSSPILNGINPVTAVNYWGNDYVGYITAAVSSYRQHIPATKLPCGFILFQDMWIQCPDGSWVNYLENYLTADIYSSTTFECHEDDYGWETACETVPR